MQSISLDLALASNSFRYFCKLVMKQKLGKIHEEWIDLVEHNKKHVVIISARGHFKTTILSICYPLWLCFKSSNAKPMIIGIISGTEKQSSEIMGLIKNHILTNPILKDLLQPETQKDNKWNESEVRTKPGHRIKSMPFNDSVRGNHFDVCICDDILKTQESTNVEEAKKVFYGVVFPTTRARKGKHVVVGTPASFTDLLSELQTKPTFVSSTYPAIILNPDGTWKEPVFPEHFSMKELQDMYDTMPSQLWAREYMCQPLTGETAVFPDEVIKHAVSIYEETKKIYDMIDKDGNKINQGTRYMGCDMAVSLSPTADFNVFTVLDRKKGFPYLYRDHYRGHLDSKGSVERILMMQNAYKCSVIGVEKTGVGWGAAEECQKHPVIGGIVKRLDTKVTNRESMLGRLEVKFRKGEIAIPNNPQLIAELRQFAYHKNNKGRDTYESLGEHDDMVMSLALAFEVAEACFAASVTFI